VVSTLVWIGLAAGRGRFWSVAPRLDEPPPPDGRDAGWPSVVAVVPARDEADILPATLRTLLTQDYPGAFSVVVVDDNSTDGTADAAASLARAHDAPPDRLRVVHARPRPPGWAGKVWAMREGTRAAMDGGPEFVLFTDADIAHPPWSVRALVRRADATQRDLTSVMVALRCDTRWEHLVIPAFVYFFGQLYPFGWVGDDRRSTAAAAGGCMLVRAGALAATDDFARMRAALIDDVTLAGLVKRAGGRLWLGHSRAIRSRRAYPRLADLWDMVARSAFTQLGYSYPALAGTVAGLLLCYAVPPAALVAGAIRARRGDRAAVVAAVAGGIGYATMSATYLPTVRRYGRPWWWALTLPASSLLYLGMTVDSARRYAAGRGGVWKGRSYPSGAG
jgi:hopene-associated glycosyltransferase HpnB